MDSDTSAWSALLYSWAPILVMIGFWVFIMKKIGTGRQAKYVERSMAFMERQEQLLERIATALEGVTRADTDATTGELAGGERIAGLHATVLESAAQPLDTLRG
jgi:hypothetical protein